MPFLIQRIVTAIGGLCIASQVQGGVITDRASSSCRCLPGDSCWPSQQHWDNLNKTVGGRLIATAPLGAPCHEPAYNAAQCSSLQEEWEDPRIHFTSSSSIMSPIFLNQSCDPFTPEARPCSIGNYVSYSINVTGPADIAAGLSFAQEKNIRLVIKNTGHDYLGKSTGKGALGLWTHNLKSLDLLRYEGSDYEGPAIKMGAGVQAFEAYEFANKNHLRIVGSQCTTVGLAGGYTQGGGHSTLSSEYGMAADNTLEWEVVTADGRHLTASSTGNSDLYWALSGGGGGTYAVVLSLTTKAHPDSGVGGAALAFSASNISLDTYWDLIGIWQAGLPALVDTGATLCYEISSTNFSLLSLTSPNSSKEQVTSMLKPFTTELDKRQIQYSLNITFFPTFFEHISTYFGPLPDGIFTIAQVTGGRLVPRSVVQQNNQALTTAMRNMVQDGTFFLGFVALNVAHTRVGNSPSSNAVLPAWRDTVLDVLIVSTWNFTEPFASMLAVEDRLTDEIVPYLERITPGSGTYLNEGDFHLQTWKQDFYGSNYERLRRIKSEYDPNDLFYAVTAVGSDAWSVTADGRLCRA